MDKSVKDTATTYFRQQAELNIPDYIFLSGKQNKGADYLSSLKEVSEDHSVQETVIPAEKYTGDKRAALVELYYEVKDCNGCPLSNSRTKMVFGAGNAAAPLMVIGEAPGYDEDIQGKPFVGKAGNLLTKMLAAINIDREKDVFITNILKCRPPENRNPDQTESIACSPMLKRQIRIIDPKAILLLGRIAAHELLSVKESIGKMRAETHNYNNIPVIVTYHPAALLRNQQYKRPAWEDLQKLQELLNKIGEYGNSEKK